MTTALQANNHLLVTSHTRKSSLLFIQTPLHNKLLGLQLKPFYGPLDFVQDNPGESVPEETFTHSHLLWSSIIPYLQQEIPK